MSELRKWRTAWPIPADGSPLNSAHLRELALMAISTAAAGVGRVGWGLAVPQESLQNFAVNKIEFGTRKILLTGLSIVLPEGVYVTLESASVVLPDNGCGLLGLVYTLPPHAQAANRPAQVNLLLSCFNSGEEAKAAGAIVLAEVGFAGHGQGSLRWVVPALEVGAAQVSKDAAADLTSALLDAAVAGEANVRYEWQAAAMALRLAARQSLATPCASFNRELARALGSIVALVRAVGGSADFNALRAAGALRMALDAPPGAPALPEELADWYTTLTKLFAPHGPLMTWLRGTGAERQRLPGYPRASSVGYRLERFDVKGAEWVELRLRGRDKVAPVVHARVDEAPFSPINLASVPGGFSLTLNLRKEAKSLDVQLPVELEVQLRETEDRS